MAKLNKNETWHHVPCEVLLALAYENQPLPVEVQNSLDCNGMLLEDKTVDIDRANRLYKLYQRETADEASQIEAN